MTCCIEKSSIFAAAFGKCIYKVSNIQYYFNQKNMNAEFNLQMQQNSD